MCITIQLDFACLTVWTAEYHNTRAVHDELYSTCIAT